MTRIDAIDGRAVRRRRPAKIRAPTFFGSGALILLDGRRRNLEVRGVF
jgi:hypothetical protein